MMIPNFIDVQVVDPKTGKFTAQWGVIFQQLFTQLQSNASDQGLVVPSQSNGAPPNNQVQIIQNSINNRTVPPTFNCQFGTLLYDSTNNLLLVALNNGLGAPQFFTVVTI
jgi:hypothetical protein